MKTIKVKFVDFWPDFEPEKSDFWESILRCGCKPELSENPDYLFFSVYSYDNLKFMDCVRILYTGENIVPDFNICDYAIGFEHMKYGDRYLRYPNYLGYRRDVELCLKKHIMPFQPKTEFCSFVYSNSGADIIRTHIYNAINNYKKVNSGGRYMNNVGEPNGVSDKLAFQQKHKFSIACENSGHPGYVTEKLVQCFAAQTVPIYWGDARIKEYFNSKAFINVTDFSSLEEMVSYIKYLDEHEESYLKILSEPAILIGADTYPPTMYKKFDDFISNIVLQPYKDAFRRNMVCTGKNLMDRYVKINMFYEKYSEFTPSKEGRLAYNLNKIHRKIYEILK